MAETLTAHLERLAALGQLAPHRRPSPADARAIWADWLAADGRPIAPTGPPAYLTPPDGNAKLSKTHRPAYSLTLAPADASKRWNTCPNFAACRRPCVLADNAGRAQFDPRIMAARVRRTLFLGDEPAAALALIADELATAGRIRRRHALRLNAASDIRWEAIAPDLLAHPWIDPYDYTKLAPEMRRPAGRYRLIYSIDERDTASTVARKAAAGPIAVVLDIPKHSPPPTWGRYPTIDGDLDDYRNALAPAGTAIVLALKGNRRARAAAIRSGFVQDPTGPRPDTAGPARRYRPAALALAPC